MPKNDEVTTTVQTVILSKERFKSLMRAKEWVQGQRGLKSGKVDETESSFRFRQRDPGDFKPGSFRTKKISEGVTIVIGRLKD